MFEIYLQHVANWSAGVFSFITDVQSTGGAQSADDLKSSNKQHYLY